MAVFKLSGGKWAAIASASLTSGVVSKNYTNQELEAACGIPQLKKILKRPTRESEHWQWKCPSGHWNSVNTNGKKCTAHVCPFPCPDFSQQAHSLRKQQRLVQSRANKPTLIITAGMCGTGKGGFLKDDYLQRRRFSGVKLEQLKKNQFLIDNLVEEEKEYKDAVLQILGRRTSGDDYSFLNAPRKASKEFAQLSKEFAEAYWASRKGRGQRWTDDEEKDRKIFLDSLHLDQEVKVKGAVYEVKNYLGLEVNSRGMDGKLNRQMAQVLHKRESLILETTGTSDFWIVFLPYIVEYYTVEVHWMSLKGEDVENRNKSRAEENAKKFLADHESNAPRLPDVSLEKLQEYARGNRTQLAKVVEAMKQKKGPSPYDRVVVWDNSQPKGQEFSKEFEIFLGQTESAMKSVMGSKELYPGL